MCNYEPMEHDQSRIPTLGKERVFLTAKSATWHTYNLFLLFLVLLTISWNIWLSPTNEHCSNEAAPLTPSNSFWSFWFYPIITPVVLSIYPPLSWTSFAISGLLYTRIASAKSLPRLNTAKRNLTVSLILGTFFVGTRIFHVGNLSEGCVLTPDQTSHTSANPYLASSKAFLYIIKYPPDGAYFCYTTAGNFILLALFDLVPEAFSRSWLKPILVYGNTSLFFYVGHLLLLMLLSPVLIIFFGHKTSWLDAHDGHSDPGVDNMWLFWLNLFLVMSVMYPLCVRYSSFKGGKSAESIWRLF
ncbi:hypothetical protein GQ53DRAFT_750854 [Thozetella sp. PMI_491]|nr:hypothetical protein GQ53DRAFT_750854 [Thozetella sp. PMI_491]